MYCVDGYVEWRSQISVNLSGALVILLYDSILSFPIYRSSQIHGMSKSYKTNMWSLNYNARGWTFFSTSPVLVYLAFSDRDQHRTSQEPRVLVMDDFDSCERSREYLSCLLTWVGVVVWRVPQTSQNTSCLKIQMASSSNSPQAEIVSLEKHGQPVSKISVCESISMHLGLFLFIWPKNWITCSSRSIWVLVLAWSDLEQISIH